MMSPLNFSNHRLSLLSLLEIYTGLQRGQDNQDTFLDRLKILLIEVPFQLPPPVLSRFREIVLGFRVLLKAMSA